jgi:hypothetical protein
LSYNAEQALDFNWWSGLESTQWLKHIQLILYASKQVVEVVEDRGASALIHCSDGWDRTSAVLSLAQLMMDPYYRTLEGFIVLVEKDWASVRSCIIVL